MISRSKLLAGFVGLCFLAPLAAWSVERLGHANSCSHCGCCCECQRVCRLVCETKDVKKTSYSCKCEDFCVPGPSQKCHTCGCGHCQACRQAACVPTAASIKTKKVLVKHEEVVKKPSYRWVVEYVCPKCATCASKSK